MAAVFFQSESVFRERARALAAQETACLQQLIPAAEIHHIGGTSVPGALTKGDVDLLVLVRAEAIKRAHHGGDHDAYRAAKGAFIERRLPG